MAIQTWNGTAYVNVVATYTGTSGNEDSISFTSPLTTTRLRFNTVAGTNPNFREIQVWQVSTSNNDAGIASIDSPYAFCPGVKNMVLTVKNFGKNNINGVTINWQLDGVTQTPITYSTLLDTITREAKVTLGSLNFLAGVAHTIKAWTSNPNSVADTVRQNDTAFISVKPSISGSFTIGGTSPDYATITAAVNDLNNYGVCGPVNFTIRAGTYNEQVSLNPVAGASSANTITFDGVSPATRTMTFVGNATNPYTFKLNGADYVTIKNLTINNTGTAKRIYSLPYLPGRL
jgi:hypothetical protein